ncbi:MAG: 1-deoxy-D-xylulose-5-phosphate synthase [Verrucomicrobia bacterium]|nr:MAG: 1-deoxy-D-xylulose-5-phosphate synthase [Verrucomicrobiota bacterium]
MNPSIESVALRDVFGQTLLDLAERIPELVVLDADVAGSTKTGAFGQAHPDRFFNVGVAEANMVDIGAGLATCGLRPVVSTFALFLTLKGADQIRNTICYNRLPVVLAGGYGGLSDSYDGASHQAITDLAVMRAMPEMTVLVPADGTEVAPALEWALQHDGPTYIRLSRNPSPILFADQPAMAVGQIRRMREGSDLTIGVCGIPTSMAIEASERLAADGIEVDLLEIPCLKPLDTGAIVESVSRTGRILTVEEHNIIGGLGGAVAEALGREMPVKMGFVGVEDCFTESGDYNELLEKYGISAHAIVAKAKELANS